VRLLALTQRGLGLRPAVFVLLAGAAAGGLAASAASSPAASSRATAHPANVGQAQQQLFASQRDAARLTGTLAGAGRRTRDLRARVTALRSQVASLQDDLSARRTELLRIRDQLNVAQRRLGGLEAAKTAAERVLGEELAGTYESGRPDIISVVLESNGFADLLERLAFAQRVGRQDAGIVAHVRSARRAVATEAAALGRLTAHAQRVAERVLSERNRVVRDRLSLVAQQLAAAKAKATATGQLATAQVQVVHLTEQLDKLRATRSNSPTPAAPGPGAGSGASGGAMPFPMPAGNTAPPATWSLGDGVNIAAPAGTPELAVCSGTVVLHGIGGLGPSAPVLRCDEPLAGHSYVYYGFAAPKRLAAIGANVARGQRLARVGDGSIPTSSGPHLEIGFADSGGAPLGAATAHQMLTLLRAAYAR
jgi:murein DD-endopeptidase MepM/ murein hydrolase activator NlpD